MGVKADNTGLVGLGNVLGARISYAGKEIVASMQLTANIQSTIETSMRYLSGCRASSASLLVVQCELVSEMILTNNGNDVCTVCCHID